MGQEQAKMGQEQSKQDQVLSSISRQYKVDEEQLTKQINYLNKKGYKFIGYLGKGAFGLVIQAQSQDYGNVAVKILDKNSENSKEIFQETTTMENLNVGGSLQYMAPEIFDNPQQLTYQLDVFSLGVTIAEMVRQQKFQGFDQIFGIKNDKILDFMPITQQNEQFCILIIQNMLSKSQVQRKNPQQLLESLQKNFSFSQSELKDILVKKKDNLNIFNDQCLVLNSYKDLSKYQDRLNIQLDLEKMNKKFLVLILSVLFLATTFAQSVNLLEEEKINNNFAVSQEEQSEEEIDTETEAVNPSLRKVQSGDEQIRKLNDSEMTEERFRKAQQGKKPLIKKDGDKKVFKNADQYKDREDEHN
ncbi:hypothetical protein ABPG74_007899 [Tetrahymena malaccensis]